MGSPVGEGGGKGGGRGDRPCPALPHRPSLYIVYIESGDPGLPKEMIRPGLETSPVKERVRSERGCNPVILYSWLSREPRETKGLRTAFIPPGSTRGFLVKLETQSRNMSSKSPSETEREPWLQEKNRRRDEGIINELCTIQDRTPSKQKQPLTCVRM